MSSLRERALELKYEMLCKRTARRQQAAKADLTRRGVTPRVKISSGYVPSTIARVFTYTNVRGLA
jgi:hypothetical protein